VIILSISSPRKSVPKYAQLVKMARAVIGRRKVREVKFVVQIVGLVVLVMNAFAWINIGLWSFGVAAVMFVLAFSE
jgi:hypothetical protein